MLQLYIGNKNYSSWSMRPWVLLRQAGIAFEEVPVRFDSFDANSQFKRQLKDISPTAKVPVLVDGDLTVWDTLAIAEYLAEKFPDRQLWPQDAATRAHARSVVAEMHSGFGQLRSHCPMNIEARLPHIGALIWRDQPGVRADVERLGQMWSELLARHRGHMLFGEFTIADAFSRRCACAWRPTRCPCPPSSPPTCSACRRCPAWPRGSRRRWPRPTSATSRSPTAWRATDRP